MDLKKWSEDSLDTSVVSKKHEGKRGCVVIKIYGAVSREIIS